jgi:hypothetical protein
VVGVRLGPAASNLFSRNDDTTTHLHAGLWRINNVVDDAASLKIGIVEMDTNAFRTNVRPVTIEGEQAFEPTKFTKIRIESARFRNTHSPANFISYELVPRTSGTGRYTGVGEEFTRSGFWFTRADPSELRPHIARDEDFGATGHTASDDWAIITWAGFDL